MTKPRITNALFGGIILSFGIITFISAVFKVDLNLGMWWPLFLIIPGIGLNLSYSVGGQTNHSLIMPSALLTFYGATFLLNNIGSVYFGSQTIWATTAFMFTLAPAIGFWRLWSKMPNRVVNLIAAIVFSGISVAVFCFSIFTTFLVDLFSGNGASSLIAPVLLICLGAAIVFLPVLGKIGVNPNVKSWMNRQNPTSAAPKPLVGNPSEVMEAEIVKDSN